MRYSKGTKVLIKNNLINLAKNPFMEEWSGKVMTIDTVYDTRYGMKEDKTVKYCGSLWSEETIECNV